MNKLRLKLLGLSFLLLLSASAFIPIVYASSLFGETPSLSSESPQGATWPHNQTLSPGEPLSPGTATSRVDKTQTIVSTLVNNEIEPFLTSTPTSYVYTTSFGSYRFDRLLPYILRLGAGDNSEDFILGSTFLVNSTTPIDITNSTVLFATNYNFTTRYSLLGNVGITGYLTIGVSFSKSSPPKISARLNSTLSDFNLEWIVIPSVKFARFSNGTVLDITGYQKPARLNFPTSYLEMGDASYPASWRIHGRIDWSTGSRSVVHLLQSVVSSLSGTSLVIGFPLGVNSIDPTIIASTGAYSSGIATQRKTFFYNGYYWAFWYAQSSSNIYYRTSIDGVSWSDNFLVTYAANGMGTFDVAQSKSRVFLAWFDDPSSKLMVKKGYLSGNSITWGPNVTVDNTQGNSQEDTSVNVAVGSDNYVWVAGARNVLVGGFWVFTFQIYHSVDTTGDSYSTPSASFTPNPPTGLHDGFRLLALANGQMFLLYSPVTSGAYFSSGTSIYWWTYGTGGWSSQHSVNLGLHDSESKDEEISSVVSSDQVVNILFRAGDGSVKYAYTQDYSNWITDPNGNGINSGTSAYYPTLSVDSLGGIHAFWILGSAIYYAMRTPTPGVSNQGGTWSWPSTPFGTSLSNPMYLTSAYLVGTTIPILWTEAYSTLKFGALPVPLYAAGVPSQPWNKPGLSPFQQYSSQLGEYVSPGDGLLYVRQTDLGIPGRGLDLAITRVYSMPPMFQSSAPFDYEPNHYYPYESLGLGWQLNFPWIGAEYLHLWDGQQYFIHWTGNNFVNQNGERFTLQRYGYCCPGQGASGYVLSTASGVVYNFGGAGELDTITDGTGNNKITFAYDNYLRISNITDTLSRVAKFAYTGVSGNLANITYGGRTVSYVYAVGSSGTNLIQVQDPLHRKTNFVYGASDDSTNKWLISEIDYPSGARSTYSQARVSITSDVYGYVVSLQNVYDKTNLVKSVSYTNSLQNGKILFAKLKFSDGTTTQGYTTYQFMPDASSNIVTDQDSTGTQLRIIRYWYGPNGDVQQQDIYRGNTAVKTFSDYNYFDEWGNLIYSRDAMGHETFASYAGASSQNQFYGPALLTQTTSGEVFHDNFLSSDLNTAFWSTGGGLGGKQISVGGGRLNMSGYSSTASWQSAWLVTKNTYSFPFYLDVSASIPQNPGSVDIAADLEISPQLTGQSNNPQDNPDRFRVILNDGPYYRVEEARSGASSLLYDSGLYSGGATSVRWRIELLNTNTATVWLDKGKGYEQVCCSISLGLAPSFSPAYIYLAFYNLNTKNYGAFFNYVVSQQSSFITLNGLQAGQRAELYDSSNNLVDEAKLVYQGDSVSLSSRNLTQGRGYIKVYDVDRTLQFTSSVREFRGGDIYTYAQPYVSQGLTKITSGFLRSSSVYVDDAPPPFSSTFSDGGDSWTWITDPAQDISGSAYHTSSLAVGEHRHYFTSTSSFENPTSGTFLAQYIYIPANLFPSEIMLEFHSRYDLSWEHRAFWGSNLINWGTSGTASRMYMGPLPSISGQWVLLVVKADDVGLGGNSVDGLSYVLYDGSAWWDYSAIGDSTTGSITVAGLTAGQRVEVFDSAKNYVTSATVASGSTQVALDLYGAGVTIFPFTGYFRIYNSTGYPLQYQTPIMSNIWGGDVYSYVQPKFYPNALSPMYGKSVTSSSSQWQTPSLILGAPDGQFAYAPANSYGATITVDMGHSIPIGDVYLDFYGYGGVQLQINTSPDNTLWNPLSTLSVPTFSSQKLQQFFAGSSPQTFRYVQVTINSFSSNPAQIDALEVLESSIHSRLSASLAFQTGRFASSPVPIQSYTKYDPTGASLETKTLHSGNWLIIGQTRDAYGNVISQTDANRQNTTYSYSSTYLSAYLTSTSTIVSGTTVASTYTYDFNTGLRLSAIDPNGYTTSYQYDSIGRPTTTIYPKVNGIPSSVTYAYNDAANVITLTDENLHNVNKTFDSLGRLIEVDRINASGIYSSEFYTYNWQNQVKTYKNLAGFTYFYTYDFLGRPTKVTNPDGTYRLAQYDDINNIATLSDENNHQKQYVSDPLNRLTEVREVCSVTNCSGSSSSTIYGQAVTFSSSEWINPSYIVGAPDGKYAYVPWNADGGCSQGATITIDMGKSLSAGDVYFDFYGYGNAQILVAVSPDNSNSNWYTLSTVSIPFYNPAQSHQFYAGRATQPFRYVKLTLQSTGCNTEEFDAIEVKNTAISYYSTKYQYNEVGDLIQLTDAKGQITRNTYDDVNRLVRVDYPDSTFTTYTYDNVSNLISKTDQNSKTTTFTYDGLGRLTKKTYQDQTTVTYTYDKASNLLTTVNSQASITYTYDPRNRQNSTSLVVGTYLPIMKFGYDKAGNLAWILYPDGTNVTYTYDYQNRITQVGSYGSFTYNQDDTVNTITLGNGVKTTYGYDNRGRPKSIITTNGKKTLLSLAYTFDNASNVKTIGTETYTYDFLNRLTNSTGPWGSIGYSYDALGNRLSKTEGGVTTNYAYGAYNKLSSAGSTQYGYNNNGDQVNKTSGGTTWTYSYTFEDKLSKVVQGSSTLGQYYYDGNEMRVKKVESGQTTISVFVGLDTIYENIIETGVTTKYIFTHGQILASVSGTTTNYYVQDTLGSTRLILSARVSTIYSTNYKPYGLEYSPTGSAIYKYTGQLQDSATGLYYLHARYYDPDLGRFISPDPIYGKLKNPQSLNRYSYTISNPLKYTDISGRDWWSDLWKGVTSAFGTASSAVGNWWTSIGPEWQHAIFLAGLTALVIGAVILSGGLASPLLIPVLAGALLGGTVSTGFYVASTGGHVTSGGLAQAFFTGTFLGAVAGIAAPLGGTIAEGIGLGAKAAGSFIGSGILSGAVAVSDIAKGVTNPLQIGVDAAIGGLTFFAMGELFPTPNTMTSIAQAERFAPNTFQTLFRPLYSPESASATSEALISQFIYGPITVGLIWNDINDALNS